MSSVEAVEVSIERMDPGWLVGERFDEVLCEARDFDRLHPPHTWLPALAGLPILADERFMAVCEGIDSRPGRSAPVLDGLYRDGALLLGHVRPSQVDAWGLVLNRSRLSVNEAVKGEPYSDAMVEALQHSAVTASVTLDHHGSTLLRGLRGLDGYRPTLGLAPALAYNSTAVVSFAASTLREQAYLLDRLRAVGVLGDPRFLPHSNPKSLASFAASPLAPSKVVVLHEFGGDDDHHVAPIDHQGGTLSILTAMGIESEVVDFDRPFLEQASRMLSIGAQSQAGELVTADETQALIARVDRLVGSVDLLAFDLVDDSLSPEKMSIGLWLLAELANLPMVVLAGARIALLGARFDDARLLRMAAFLADE
ncbi:hypothetical protein [Ferrimicrobium acidiphilum]|uniref:hypothetical protein n=1 Tax=Ferrimicrobium acidiphilum TaxID=121039 RepID=UPI000A6BC9C9|nr:hypothetical protein [Ferrimicrobium acidiphilum]